MTSQAHSKQEPIEDYLAHDAISSSVLRTVHKKSCGHAFHDLFHPRDKKAFDFGSAVHAAVLEPELLDNYAVRPATIPDRRTKAGKAAYAEFLAENEGKIILDAVGVYDDLHGCVQAVRDNELAAELVARSNGETELSIYWPDKWGMECKARPDKIAAHPKGFSCLVDLKTTTDASYRACLAATMKFGYAIQAAHCLRGAAEIWGNVPRGYALVFVEKTAPYACSVYELDIGFIDWAESARLDALRQWHEATKNHVYPMYENDIMELPEWLA